MTAAADPTQQPTPDVEAESPDEVEANNAPATDADAPAAPEADADVEPQQEAEEPGAEEPAVEEPGAEEPGAEEPAVEEPAVEEPGAEEPGAEEPAVEEPAVEEPADEEPAVEEPAAEEQAFEGPDVEVPDAEELAAAERASEAPASDEAAADEPASGEAAADEPASDEIAADEQGSEEPAAEAPVAPAVPRPSPRPVPVPRPAAGVAPRPTAPAEPWGRVDDDGTVSVREGDQWRVVGQYPDGSHEEALAYFERKYTDLASEVTLLEVRHRRGGASASDLRAAAKMVSDKVAGAAAVGDLASLEARITALTESLSAASATEAAAAREAVDEAIKARTELVEKAEALAARDPRTVQWKQASTELTTLFDQWQSQQQNGPRLPKATAQALWKRFRDARATVDRHRREFYAELDEAHKSVRDRKAKLVERAEALAPKGEDGIAQYRELLDQWKTAGRAGKKADDALWARFKAAGDALYSARTEREAADAEASREKITAKRALIDEAKAVADERDLTRARSLLTGIQRRWDDIGRIFPRDAERALDDDLRKIEQGLRSREDAEWKRNDPEQKARANDMTRQLTEAIEKLQQELAAAEKSGDKRAIAKAEEALEARKGWLRALGG
ncbi:DUF349 domain-containing protein [Microbacterium sp. F51-2R]|uniref:DUF349 domain-containing protein n=1 Tax=Microbacterium sp. F51-2R TaxID=3445777 RepID=UPI003FA0CEC6